MSSIFSVPNWQSGAYYVINDIVKNGDFFYYALVTHTAGGSFEASKWGGTTTDANGDTVPHFFWKPSYRGRSPREPKIKLVQFGDGYQQRLPDGINNNLMRFNLIFDGRNDNETKAIEHFLTKRAGSEFFLFTPPAPFATQRRFVCRNWDNSPEFYNNNIITVNFEEVTA